MHKRQPSTHFLVRYKIFVLYRPKLKLTLRRHVSHFNYVMSSGVRGHYCAFPPVDKKACQQNMMVSKRLWKHSLPCQRGLFHTSWEQQVRLFWKTSTNSKVTSQKQPSVQQDRNVDVCRVVKSESQSVLSGELHLFIMLTGRGWWECHYFPSGLLQFFWSEAGMCWWKAEGNPSRRARSISLKHPKMKNSQRVPPSTEVFQCDRTNSALLLGETSKKRTISSLILEGDVHPFVIQPSFCRASFSVKSHPLREHHN